MPFPDDQGALVFPLALETTRQEAPPDESQPPTKKIPPPKPKAHQPMLFAMRFFASHVIMFYLLQILETNLELKHQMGIIV